MSRIRRIHDDVLPVDAEAVRQVQENDDLPEKLRKPRHVKQRPSRQPPAQRTDKPMVLVVSDRHHIHHIRERGYVESPARIQSILTELEASGLFEKTPPRTYTEKYIRAVHSADMVSYLRKAGENLPPGKSIYPYVFPIRNAARPPKDLAMQAGYYCIDTFTPVNRNAYVAARRSVDCALTAADQILSGRRAAYALVRPPGHHSERSVFGGFCYFNSTAIAAKHLSAHGKVAIVDVDYHHGNGQQEIFYQRDDVLTVSIHGHPSFAYPYFSGFADERGDGSGEGFNLNLPLPEVLDGVGYREALAKAIRRVADFRPDFLIVALGLDTAKGDPTGTWLLTAKDFELSGRMLGELDLPTLIVQEGGYRTRTLGVNARRFFVGFSA